MVKPVKKLLIIIACCLAGYNLYGQNFDQCKCDSVIALLQSSTNSDSSAYSLIFKAFNLCDDPLQRISFTKEAINHAVNLNDYNKIAYAYLMNGMAYWKIGSLTEANKSYLEALEIYESIGNESGSLSAYYYLATILAEDNKFEDAIKYSIKTLELYKKQQDSIRYASVLLNIGEYNRKLNHLPSSLMNFNESIEIFTEKKYAFGAAYGYGNIGLVYLAQDSLNLAIENLNLSLSILEPLSDNYSVSVYQEGLAHVYQKQKDYKKAETLALQSLALAREDHLIEQIRDANFRLSEIYKESGAHLKAYQSHVAYVNYKDSLINEKNIREIENMRRQYEVAQKQQEVDELTKEQDYYKTIGIALGIIILLAISLAGVQLYHSRRRKRINLKLQKQQKELEQLNETKDKFFSIISHDLRSPIATFQSFAEVFDVMVSNKEYDNLKKVSVQMKQSSASIMDLVDNLFSWGLNQMGEIPFHPEILSLSGHAQLIVDVLSEMAKIKGIHLASEVDESIKVNSDAQMLQAILRNLVNNALKFTFTGGYVTILAEQNQHSVRITVRDTGVGIQPNRVKHLFDLDATKSTAGTQNERGVGLGLRLVHEFTERHGGAIHIKSVVGKGTDMIVELPC